MLRMVLSLHLPLASCVARLIVSWFTWQVARQQFGCHLFTVASDVKAVSALFGNDLFCFRDQRSKGLTKVQCCSKAIRRNGIRVRAVDVTCFVDEHPVLEVINAMMIYKKSL